PRRQHEHFECPSACWPSKMSFLLHKVPWMGMLTVKGEAKTFPEEFYDWSMNFGPGRWIDNMHPLQPTRSPFWLTVFVDGPSGHPDHAHIILGGLDLRDLDIAKEGWPYARSVHFAPKSMKRGGPWGLLHYALSQQGTRVPHVHAFD